MPQPLDTSKSCLVTFHRLGDKGQPVWYPVELYEIDTLPEHLRLNPGTREVNLADGTPVWKEGIGYMRQFEHVGLADIVRNGGPARSKPEE